MRFGGEMESDICTRTYVTQALSWEMKIAIVQITIVAQG